MVRIYTFVFKKKTCPVIMSAHPAHQIWTLKVMQRNFMNCVGLFQMPMSVIVAVYIPT